MTIQPNVIRDGTHLVLLVTLGESTQRVKCGSLQECERFIVRANKNHVIASLLVINESHLKIISSRRWCASIT